MCVCPLEIGWYWIQGREPVGKVGDTHIIEEKFHSKDNSFSYKNRAGKKTVLAFTCQNKSWFSLVRFTLKLIIKTSEPKTVWKGCFCLIVKPFAKAIG